MLKNEFFSIVRGHRVQRDAIAFRILEVTDKTVLTDAGFRAQRLAALLGDAPERDVDIFHLEVHHRARVRRHVALRLDQTPGRARRALRERKPRHLQRTEVLRRKLNAEHVLVERLGATQIVDGNFKPGDRIEWRGHGRTSVCAGDRNR
jgi:hypothetical protein